MKKFVALPVLVLLLAAAILVAAMGAVSGAKPAAKATKAGTITIGHIIDETGPEAQIGTLFGKALDAANKLWPTAAGKTIKVVTVDAAGTSAGAVNAAKRLVLTDHVAAILGPTQDAQKVAVANYVKKAHVPLILYNPSATAVYTNNPYVIALGGNNAQDGTAMANYALNTLKWKSMDVFTKDLTSCRLKLDPSVAYFKKHGGKIIQTILSPESTTDYSPFFTTIKQANGIWAWLSGSDAMGFWNSYVQSGTSNKMKVAAFFTGGFLDAFIVNNLSATVQKAVEGTPGPSMYSPDHTSAQNTQFISTMTPILGYPPDQTASASWQAYMVLESGLVKAKGNTSAKTLIAGILASKTTGPEGLVKFAKGQNVAIRTVYIEKCEEIPHVSGKYHYVTVKTYNNVAPTGMK